MKILITIPYKKTGGIYSFCEAIVPYFSLHDLTNFKRGVKENKKNKVLIIFEQVINYFSFIRKLLLNRYDAIFINSSLGKSTCIRDGIYIILSKIFKTKVVLFIHGFDEDCLDKKLIIKGFLLSDRIIVLADEFKKHLETAGYKNEINISKNPVRSDIIQSISDVELNEKKIRKPKNILFLARIEEKKGIMMALKIFEKLVLNHPDLNFYIAGVGNKLKDAKNYSINRGIKNVDFVGFVTGKEKIELLKKCDILLFVSTYKEGLPINVLEAMISGMAIITRPVGGIKDFFENEKMGYASESLEIDEFVIKLECLIKSPHFFSICEYNYTYARKNFTSKIIAEKLISIINEVINE